MSVPGPSSYEFDQKQRNATSQKTSTAWQRAFKAKTTWRAAVKRVAPINAWGMRETRLEELLGRNSTSVLFILIFT